MTDLDPRAPDLDLIAASIRADRADLRTFLDVLAAKLTGALPGQVTVEREGGLFARTHRVRRIGVAVGPRRYELEWAGAELVARAGEGAGGLEAMPLDRCLEQMAHDLVEQARTSTNARSSLDGLLAGRLPAEQIARPPEAQDQIVFRWPAARLSPASELLVNPGEEALLVHDGQVDGPLPPGRHPLGGLDWGPSGDPAPELEATIYLVATREFAGLRFGGTVDKVVDPPTGLAVGLRVFGDYSLRVVDSRQVVISLGGSDQSLANARFTDLMRDLLLKVLREDVVAHIGEQGWPILGLAAHGEEIERETVTRVQGLAARYGLQLIRLGNFTISMKEEDEALLTAHRARLAARAAEQPDRQLCPGCGAANLESARFCQSCGRPLAGPCPGCGADNPASARFCQGCGRPLGHAAEAGGSDA